ncbi:MAG TPA: hypothetical protein VGF24_37245 [Vicinamibacterales bacterium]|jgi:hypothetical protein
MSEPVVEAEIVGEEARNLPAVVASEAIMARGEITVDEVVAQRDKIIAVMDRVMVEGKHYGKIPGISKPTLLKPGAEAINVALRLAPDYESDKHFDGDHLTVTAKCILRHIPTGLTIASGEGLCSTRESKYAKRKAMRLCPECGEPQIRRSRYAPKPSDSNYVEGSSEKGWYCWKKEGGCGVNFAYNDPRIVDQEEGVIENPDLPDTWNTVLKMADKRALIAAVLNGTAASDVFTQDVEDVGKTADDSPGGGGEGEGGSLRNSASRRENQPAVPVPKSWADIETAARACDNPEESWLLFRAFRRAASHHLWGVVADDPQEDASLLTGEQWSILGQKCAGAVVWMLENVEHEGPFMLFTESHWRAAWGRVMGGQMLEIPDYEPPPPPEEPPDPDTERQREAESAA